MAKGTPKSDGDAFFGFDANGSSTMIVEAGENITAGNVVFVYGNGHASEGKAFVATTATADKIRATGIATTTVTTGNDAYVVIRGLYSTTGLTDRKHYYLGAAGALSTTVSAVRIGYSNGTTDLYINIEQDDRDIVGTIKSYLKSHAGTPPTKSAFWKDCDGTLISDAESPLNFAGAGEAPNLNGTDDDTRRFLRGSTVSDNGTDNSFTGTSSHFHAPGTGTPAAAGTTTSQPNRNHIPTCADVFFIMKIK